VRLPTIWDFLAPGLRVEPLFPVLFEKLSETRVVSQRSEVGAGLNCDEVRITIGKSLFESFETFLYVAQRQVSSTYPNKHIRGLLRLVECG